MSLLGEFKKFKIPGPESDVPPGVSLLGEFKIPGPESDVPPGVSLLGEFKIPGPESDDSLLGEFKKFKSQSDVSSLGEFNKFKILGPQRDVSVLGEFKQFKNSKSRVQKVMFLYTGSSNSSNAVFCAVGGPVTGLLGWAPALHEVGFPRRVRGPPS